MRKTKAQMALEQKRIEISITLYMRYLGLDILDTGTLVFQDEDTDEYEVLRIDGNLCKYPDPKFIQDPYNETLMDVYTTTKNTIKLFYNYMMRMGYKIEMVYLTNVKTDKWGHLEVMFANGVKYISNDYYKDSLKYIDLIMQLEQAIPDEFAVLREIDTDGSK